MRSPSAAFEALKRLGLRPLAHYAWYRLKLHSGWIRLSTPAGVWSGQLPIAQRDAAREDGLAFPVDQGLQDRLSRLPAACRQHAVRVAEDVLNGRFEVFGRRSVDLGWPPDWSQFVPVGDGPSTPKLASDRHWTAYRLDDKGTDIKLVWEPSRFAWVYALGRGFTWTGDSRFAAGFSTLLDSWQAANPPNLGPQWISGQEVGMRLMALIFAWSAFSPWLQGRGVQRAALLEAIAVHAHRIPPTLDYAQAQDNNHLLVEAAALFMAGALFPGLARAGKWRRTGRILLGQAAARQFFPDGGYAQYSVTYARLAIETLLWGAVAGQRAQDPLPPPALEALERGADWLEAMALGAAGRAPNFGPNDGAYLLPLTACEFEDFRPTLDAARRFLGRSPLPAGAWSELGDWFGLPPGAVSEREEAPPARIDRPQAGQYFLGAGRIRAVLRCAQFTRRPGHADQLHLDVWHDGQPVTLDPGSYLYNGPDPWDNALAGEDVHNLPTLDGRPAMKRAGRFLWLGWAQGEQIGRWGSAESPLEVLTAVHDGYRAQGVRLQRSLLRLDDGALVVVDEAFGQGDHALVTGWNLPDLGWQVDGGRLSLIGERHRCRIEFSQSEGEPSVFRQGALLSGPGSVDHPTWGWVSPTYTVRHPCLRVLMHAAGPLPLRLITWFVWDEGTPQAAGLDWAAPRSGRPPWSHLSVGDHHLSL